MRTFVYHENPSSKHSFYKSGDAWCIDDESRIFAVADSPLRKLIIETKEYPFDDYGYEAASTFCNSFVKHTKESIKIELNKEIMKNILLQCNRDILALNKSLGKGYKDLLNYDVAETVGIGGIIHDGILCYGGVEDCYVNVLRGSSLDNLAKWNYQIKKASKYVDYISSQGKLEEYIPSKLIGKLGKENYWEPLWCNHLRNNINAKDSKGNLVGWGCFTGEEEIEDFIQVHELKLELGDHILLFSDGMIPLLENEKFMKWFLENVNNSAKFQYEMRLKSLDLLNGTNDVDKEKTLIYYRY